MKKLFKNERCEVSAATASPDNDNFINTQRGKDVSEREKTSKEEKDFIKERLLLAITGICTGIANGFFGGGGGMIVVPMLVFLLKREPRRAHATALLVILPISVISGFIYAAFGKFSLPVGIPSGIGVIAGGVIGALLLKKISGTLLTKIFAFVMLAAGIKLLFF